MCEKKNPWRPTKYLGNATLEKAWYYMHNFGELGDMVPSKLGLAEYLEIGITTLERWEKDENKSSFRGILERMKSKQGRILINKGLGGEFNPLITKLMLGKHGLSDKSDNTVSGPNGGPIETKSAVILGEMTPSEACNIYQDLME